MISMLEFPLTAAFGVYLGLCKKCRRTPILFTPVPPPTKFTFLPRGTVPRRRDSVAAPGGEVDLYARVSSHLSDWRTFGLHLGLCKKVSADPYFYSTRFPPPLSAEVRGRYPPESRRSVLRRGGDGSTDAERSKERAQALAECRESALRTRCGSSDTRAAWRGRSLPGLLGLGAGVRVRVRVSGWG